MRASVQEILDRGWEFDPVIFGKVWEKDEFGRFSLPEHTMGWQMLAFMRKHFTAGIVGTDGKKLPFEPSPEQERLFLWWYAVDENGTWLYQQLVLQRLKGWGKDPVAAAMCLLELLGPTQFIGWANAPDPSQDIKVGDPVGVRRSDCWIDVAATTRDQSKNTMQLFSIMVRKESYAELGIRDSSFQTFGVKGPSPAHFIQAVTSNPGALEGHRTTLTIANEPHHWNDKNNGTEMWDTIARNGAKMGRVVVITNAPNPAHDSVGLSLRLAEEDIRNGDSFFAGVLYDSLELDRKHGLIPPEVATWATREDEEPLDPAEQEALTRAYLREALKVCRGDSWWVTIEPKINLILRGDTPEVTARRFWFNQTDSDEETWVPAACISAAVNPLVKPLRNITSDQVRVGWEVVSPADEIVIFGDCSKSSDDTGLVGCRLSDGYVFTIGHWRRPPELDTRAVWRVDRADFKRRVMEAVNRFNVAAVWIDPSHTMEDGTGEAYWGSVMLDLHQELAGRLDKAYWPIKSGDSVSCVMWDMTGPTRAETFIRATMDVRNELLNGWDEDYPEPEFQIDGYFGLTSAFRHCRTSEVVRPGGFVGTAVRKDSRGSSKKIDLAVCAIGSRLLRRTVLSIRASKATDEREWGMAVGY